MSLSSDLSTSSTDNISSSSGYSSSMSGSKKSSVASSNNGSLGRVEDEASWESEHDLVPAGLARPGDRVPVIAPSYTMAGESLRHTVPGEMQCSMFCGGRRCKYESSSHWKPEQMALKGIYSHWVTEGILAMARPNTQLIRDGGLIQEFRKHGIKSVINLQTPGEHASCGPKLDKSGFSYDPNDFMSNDVFFYNFAWKDFGDANMNTLLDMVKVLSFALSEGKVAVHCHAGLGRTGVLIASYLVYYLRVRSNDALRYLRHKRPGSVQTRKQIDCVKEFESFFLPQCLVFSNKPPMEVDRKLGRFTLDQHIKRQRMVIHGYEARALKYIPKVVHRICERLLKLSGCGPEYSVGDGDDGEGDTFTKQFLAFRYDDKGGSKLSLGVNKTSTNATPSESMAVTRRSSRSYLFSSEGESDSMGNSMSASASSSGMPTPNYGGTRPGSETNSYVQSCSSALSGVDDTRLDDILGDGIRNQSLVDNRVTKELQSHQDLRDAANRENLPKVTAEQVYQSAMSNHAEIIRRDEGSWATRDIVLIKQYRTELNFKLSAWDRIDTEDNLFVLTALLFEWLEHLRHPLLDKDGITYVVIYCDNVHEAMKRLPNAVCYVVEYLARFVARLQPLTREQSEHLMLRLIASLTHQSIEINDAIHPSAKKFPKLRNGTADSTKKFMMRLLDAVTRQQRMREEGRLSASMMGAAGTLEGFKFGNSAFGSLNASSTSMTTHAGGTNPAAAAATPNVGNHESDNGKDSNHHVTFAEEGESVTVNAMVHRQETTSAKRVTSGRVTSGRRASANNNDRVRKVVSAAKNDDDDESSVATELLDELEAELK